MQLSQQSIYILKLFIDIERQRLKYLCSIISTLLYQSTSHPYQDIVCSTRYQVLVMPPIL